MFDLERSHGATVVHVRGDVDVLTSETFRAAILGAEARPGRVVVSLLECPYLDSTGLTVLIAAQRRLGDRFSVVLLHEGNVRKIIEIASLAQFLRIVPTLAMAEAG